MEMPARVLQVGCGVSTEVMRRASTGWHSCMSSSSPFPTRYLVDVADGNEITLLTEGAVDAHAEGISAGDLLFVDSTHSGKPGARRGFAVLR